ncbi:serine/threonine-protein kinase Nek1-like isoform X2 [Petromyzon marinus]|uniref:serine/threonine-protein kinase Nek1-like isoform X2 n=1 Tax=Petromyzon marinus TaxID=7757 RepID=UPI003F70C4E8
MERYTMVSQIGEGSFGKAMLVKSKADGHLYVIKEINISRMSPKERDEARKEVCVLANMRHPNIVSYKESFEERGNLYIVMDYCEGGDLFKRINAQKGVLFSEDQILDWLVQLCLALKHVHDRKILHRDIKSQNIFLTKAGIVQLGDFGIARVLNSTTELARTCIGTPYYLSPEICENKPYNHKSDMWALGCVLYEMCTLRHAFEAGNMKNLVLKIIRGSFPPVSAHYSSELRSTLSGLLRRDPRARPPVAVLLSRPLLMARAQRLMVSEQEQEALITGHPNTTPASPVGTPAPAGAAAGPSHPQGVKRAAPAMGCGNQKVTRPAAKYGIPLSNYYPRPASTPENIKRKQRDQEKGSNRKEHQNLLKQENARRLQKQQELYMQHARQQGWRRVLAPPQATPVVPAAQVPKVCVEPSAQQQKEPTQVAQNKEAKCPPDRERQVKEFHQRKREAALNKARAQGRPVSCVPKSNFPVVCYSREEEEYLLRLKNIRLQNFNERLALQNQQVVANNMGVDPAAVLNEGELRQRKIQALKEQADARATQLKELLERKRREAYEREKRMWEEHLVVKGVKAAPRPASASSALGLPHDAGGPMPPDETPTVPSHPSTSLTAAFGAIGVEQPLPAEEPTTAESHLSPTKKEKREILRRLNMNMQAEVLDVKEGVVVTKGAKVEEEVMKKSEGAVDSEVVKGSEVGEDAMAHHVGDPGPHSHAGADLSAHDLPAKHRQRWGFGRDQGLGLSHLSLEETAGAVGDAEIEERRQWERAQPSTVLRALRDAPISTTHTLLGNTDIEDLEAESLDEGAVITADAITVPARDAWGGDPQKREEKQDPSILSASSANEKVQLDAESSVLSTHPAAQPPDHESDPQRLFTRVARPEFPKESSVSSGTNFNSCGSCEPGLPIPKESTQLGLSQEMEKQQDTDPKIPLFKADERFSLGTPTSSSDSQGMRSMDNGFSPMPDHPRPGNSRKSGIWLLRPQGNLFPAKQGGCFTSEEVVPANTVAKYPVEGPKESIIPEVGEKAEENAPLIPQHEGGLGKTEMLAAEESFSEQAADGTCIGIDGETETQTQRETGLDREIAGESRVKGETKKETSKEGKNGSETLMERESWGETLTQGDTKSETVKGSGTDMEKWTERGTKGEIEKQPERVEQAEPKQEKVIETAAMAVKKETQMDEEMETAPGNRGMPGSPRRHREGHMDPVEASRVDGSSLLLSLSRGLFDVYSPMMLRTCSMPDLRQGQPGHGDLGCVEAGDYKGSDGFVPRAAIKGHRSNVEDQGMSKRESLEEGDIANASGEGSGDNNGGTDGDIANASGEGSGDDNGGTDGDIANASGEGSGDDNGGTDGDDSGDEEIIEELEKNSKNCGEIPEEECIISDGDDDELAELQASMAQLLEEESDDADHTDEQEDRLIHEDWQSDESEAEGGDSVFSRLEAMRVTLETEMGVERFLEAYRTIQASHEDEDESVEDVSVRAREMLEPGFAHFYQKILHLVMADGAYQDNDE